MQIIPDQIIYGLRGGKLIMLEAIIDEERKTIREWCNEKKLNANTFRSRIKVHRFKIKYALNKPADSKTLTKKQKKRVANSKKIFNPTFSFPKNKPRKILNPNAEQSTRLLRSHKPKEDNPKRGEWYPNENDFAKRIAREKIDKINEQRAIEAETGEIWD